MPAITLVQLKSSRNTAAFPENYRSPVPAFRRGKESELLKSALSLNLFCNSPKETCVLACRTQKPKARRGTNLCTNAVNEVTRKCAHRILTDKRLQRVVRTSQDFNDEPSFTRVVTTEEIRAKEGNLTIPVYGGGKTQAHTDAVAESATTALPDALGSWLASSTKPHLSLRLITLFNTRS